MTIAVMQPYVFPYIGYFQLMTLADIFVLYDDVNFINRGWVNRNNILVNSKPMLFTIPLKEASQNKLIRDIDVLPKSGWESKLLRTLEMSYKKAPYYEPVRDIVCSVVAEYEGSIAELAHRSIKIVKEYIDIPTTLIPTSACYANQHLKGQERIMDICLQEKAQQYINPLGGRELYNDAYFAESNIKLNFLKPIATPYKQIGSGFIPWLSIVDVLMFNDVATVSAMLQNGELL